MKGDNGLQRAEAIVISTIRLGADWRSGFVFAASDADTAKQSWRRWQRFLELLQAVRAEHRLCGAGWPIGKIFFSFS